MKKRYLLGLCLVGALALTGCGNKNKLMKASDVDANTEAAAGDEAGASDGGQKADDDESTEAYENVTRVVEKNVSEKLSNSAGNVTVVVGSLDGYVRNFGSPALIQYLSTGSVYTDISYQLYEGYKAEQITKLAETFANSADYGNQIKDKMEEYTYEDYTGVTLSYENNGKTVYEMVLMKEVKKDCILAITILQDNEKLNNDAIAKLTTSVLSIATGKEDAESTEASSEQSSESSSEETTEATSGGTSDEPAE